jgi:hypothetical protein
MEYVGELKAIAHQMAAREQAKISQLEKRLATIEDEKALIEVQLQLARTSRQRAHDFQPVLGADYQCPTCFIKGKGLGALGTIVGKSFEVRFRCSRCDEEFSFSAR